MRTLILTLSLLLVASGCTFRSVKPTLGDSDGDVVAAEGDLDRGR